MGRLRQLLRRLARAGWHTWSAEIRAIWRRSPVRPRTVLYESFAGNGALCNPEAVFRELLASEDMADLTHTWVLAGTGRHAAFRAEFAGHPRVSFVSYRSAAYFRALATSEYLLNNATFPPEFTKRDGQVYVNTWHGTPLKHMGYDMPNGALESANTLRNFVSADFLVSQNAFMTERMYETAYKLRGAFRGRVIEGGNPRVDRQFAAEADRPALRAQLEAAGVFLGDREIVLYAPTWKGQSFASPRDNARELIGTVRALQDLLGTDRYVVLLKPHQIVHHFVAADPANRAVLIPNDLPTNVVLGLTDVLITDYSSIFFDFLASGRPVLFFTPDATDYASTRGTYFAPDELPGTVCTDVDELAAGIRVAGNVTPHQRYAEWRERFAGHDDGAAASRLVDIVFRGRPGRTLSLAEDRRIPILLHLGSMRSNGITTSALNLLAAIDHDHYDVSVVFGRPGDAQQRANQARIHPAVRQFLRAGGMGGGLASHLARRLAEVTGGRDVHASSVGQRRMWGDEWRRIFGAVTFSRIIDFDGYGPFWATLLLHGVADTHAIWLHNEMLAERERVIRGRRRIRLSLGAVFALYHEYDALVSVSPALADVNRAGLSTRFGVPPERFLAARNLVDGAHVVAGLTASLADALAEPSGATAVATAVVTEALAAKGDTRWFVTLGRFSTEKNQARLVRAFSRVHREDPAARLLLIGYGPLRDVLVALIRELDLAEAAWVIGPLADPFPVLAAADCFVLSSDYEGQPMVILEAAIVGMPIVAVDFATVRDALPDGGIHVVERDDAALADGMLAFLRGEVQPQHLDVDMYTRTALAEFALAIGAGDAHR